MKNKLLSLPIILLSGVSNASTLTSDITSQERITQKPLEEIVGGSISPRKEWAVYGGYGCTGFAISANYIIAARHCENGATSGATGWYYSTDNNNHVSNVKEWANINVPTSGDIVLLRLQKPHPLNYYAPIDLDYDPAYGDSGKIYGYGSHGSIPTTDKSALYQANVEIHYRENGGSAAGGGTTIKISGIDGSCDHGDSGGPLFVNSANNSVVGTASTGANNGSNINANCYYADLKQAKQFILEETGSGVTGINSASSSKQIYNGKILYTVVMKLSGNGLSDAQTNLVATSENGDFFVEKQIDNSSTKAITLLPNNNGEITFFTGFTSDKNTSKYGRLRIQAGKVIKYITIYAEKK
ncbi:trypsin-like serine protease [Serratia marcescens]|uniref:trypsin-like serine protease n=1 Tax=Serratia marcescens TaxID=615 RepID=UPI001EEF806C|nr:trypsin-like serine protease [Serratia marcescens]ULH10477.1 trypsin-like serine protease [Serratia marcescens]